MLYTKYPLQKEWKEENLFPFDELILSWNAPRPLKGNFLFYVSVKTTEWTSPLLYASWGSSGQSSFSHSIQDTFIKIHQDTLEITEGQKATGFKIEIKSENGAHIESIYGLHVYTNGDKKTPLPELPPTSLHLKIPGLSQMTIDHIRHKDLCSPAATTAVIQYLLNDRTIHPKDFADSVWDAGFDIFGNWVFNMAEASTLLGKNWHCWVERLDGFHNIHDYLSQGIPVVVSVRGPLPKSAKPYIQGHLLAVTGYDALHQKVLSMDPAFPSDSETHISYDVLEFTEAWKRRGNIAYIFKSLAK